MTAPIPFLYEPFLAGFTGTLTTFTSADGSRYTLAKPYLRITKGQPFVIKMHPATKHCQLIPVVNPDPSIR